MATASPKNWSIFSDKELTRTNPLSRIERQLSIWVFVALELLVFGATFAITQTIAAIGFPVIILASIPFRTFVMPKWFRREELLALDEPTAGAFVMESVGGAYGADDSGSTTPNVSGRDPNGGVLGDEHAVVDDTLERGESYELKDRVSGELSGQGFRHKRRATGSETNMEHPDIGMRRRSRSTRGRPTGKNHDQ